jgi:hypothetical protein
VAATAAPTSNQPIIGVSAALSAAAVIAPTFLAALYDS